MIRRWGLFAALLMLAGCHHAQPRAQSEDAPDRPPAPDAAAARPTGDVPPVANAEDIPVVGIGLVTRLDATGGGVPPGPERAALEDHLRKLGVENIKELFASNT